MPIFKSNYPKWLHVVIRHPPASEHIFLHLSYIVGCVSPIKLQTIQMCSDSYPQVSLHSDFIWQSRFSSIFPFPSVLYHSSALLLYFPNKIHEIFIYPLSFLTTLTYLPPSRLNFSNFLPVPIIIFLLFLFIPTLYCQQHTF